MNTPTKPGQRCRVIGGRSKTNGEGDGPNIGKIVRTAWLHSKRAGDPRDSVAVWHCTAEKGQTLVTYHGGAGQEADFLAIWLEVIPEDPVAPKVNQEHKELEQ